ncbi:MAG: TetR family transcriptional regulator C-terminal domain-containing protein [Solirubrobacteraceae bacterium]|nr:TetR family transcriptional regulator C-terminal domain-containing protein [Solirubrobacteraceae bacterium]
MGAVTGASPPARSDTGANSGGRGRGRPSTLDRQAVLDATWRVIAARGIDGARYADIAEASGTPVSTLQNAFGTLQSLLAAAIGHASNRDNAFLATIPGPEDASAEARLEALAVGAVGPGFGAESYLVWLELWRASARDTGLAGLSADAYDGWWAVAESIVAQGQRDGVFTTAESARDLAITVIAILDGIALALLIPAQRGEAETAGRIALAGVRRLLAP